MITQNKMKEFYEGKLDDLNGMECLQLCQASLVYPLDNIEPKDYVLEYVYESAKAVRLCNPTEDYLQLRDYRSALIDGINDAVNVELYEIDRVIEPKLKDRIRAQYNYIRDYQLGLQNESALMGGACIVPYQGTLRKHREDDTGFIEGIIKACKTKKSKELLDKEIKHKMEYEAFTFLNELNSDFDLDDNMALVDILSDPCISLESAVMLTHTIKEYNGDFSDFMVNAVESLFGLNPDLVELVNNLSDALGYDYDMSALESLQSYNDDRLAKLLSDSALLSGGDGYTSEGYDLQSLMDYINAEYSLQQSDYANSLITEINDDISDVFDYDDIMVAEVNDEKLCAAVVDISRGNTPVLVCIDRSGDINTEELG